MPGTPFTLGITVNDSDGSAQSDVRVYIRNENTNDSAYSSTNSSGQVQFQLANASVFENGWTVGDIVSYWVLYSGYEASGSFSLTDTGGTTKTLTLSAVPVTPSLRYFTVQEFLETFNLPAYDSDNNNGLKPETIVRVGQSMESQIDQLTHRTWDDNNGSYYTATQEYHNADGAPSMWPESGIEANVSSQHIFFVKHPPIQSLTTFQVNKASPNTTADWDTLTEDDNEIKVKNSIGRIEITDSSDYPASGKDQVRITYTYGESSVPNDIKRLAILMTGKAFASQSLQRLNIDVTETEGLNNSIQNYSNYDMEINSIIDNRKFGEVRLI